MLTCWRCACRKRSKSDSMRSPARPDARKAFYAREAILRHLDDLEDAHLAQERLRRNSDRVTLELLEREFEAEQGR